MRSALGALLAGLALAAAAGPATAALAAGGETRAPEARSSEAPLPEARRVVTLAPHLAELVYAAGGGERLVGVSAYTDYPEAAAELPEVGDAFRVDLERLAELDPDLVLAWKGGNPQTLIEGLRESGFEVLALPATGIADVAASLERIGERLGTQSRASAAAAAFRDGIAALRERHRGRLRLSVFYQVSAQPLYTIGGDHYVTELIGLCGGRNVFEDLLTLAPLVSLEAVLLEDPQVMLAGGDPAAEDSPLEFWSRWEDLTAVRYDNRYVVDAAVVARLTPRLLEGARAVCEVMELARGRIAAERGQGRG